MDINEFCRLIKNHDNRIQTALADDGCNDVKNDAVIESARDIFRFVINEEPTDIQLAGMVQD